MSTNAQPTTAATPKVLSGIAAKIQQQREAAMVAGNSAGRVATTVTYDASEDQVYIGFKMSDFVEAMGKSKSAKSEGATLTVSAKVEVARPADLVAELGPGNETYLVQGQPWIAAKILV